MSKETIEDNIIREKDYKNQNQLYYISSMDKYNKESDVTSLVKSEKPLPLTAAKAFEDVLMKINIPEQVKKSHQEGLQKSQSKDLQQYKAENNWLKRIFKKTEAKPSAQTKLLEAIVNMEDKICQGVESFLKIPEVLDEMKQKYQDFIKERSRLRQKLKEYDFFFKNFDKENERSNEFVESLKNYAAYSDKEKEEKLDSDKNLIDLQKLENYSIMILIDEAESRKFERANIFEARKLELALLKDRYLSLEKQILMMKGQNQQFLESFGPGLISLSRLKGKYEELEQYSKNTVLLDINEVIESSPRLIEEAQKAIIEAQEQLETCSCNGRAKIKVSADLDNQLALEDLSFDNPSEECQKLLDRPLMLEEEHFS